MLGADGGTIQPQKLRGKNSSYSIGVILSMNVLVYMASELLKRLCKNVCENSESKSNKTFICGTICLLIGIFIVDCDYSIRRDHKS